MINTPLDIVYPLGKGSLHGDAELRYSLRSLERFAFNYRNVYIVGERPAWLQNVIHIPAEDNDQKETNIMRKISMVCDWREELSMHFLMMNDDHFFTSAVNVGAYPYYHKGSLEGTISRRKKNGLTTGYYDTLWNTSHVLHAKRLPTLNYDIHTPVIYNKEHFTRVMREFNFDVAGSFCIKSLYCNSLPIQGTKLTECRINRPMSYEELQKRIAGRHVFSVGDDGMTTEMFQLLNTLYPQKSKYEQ